MTFKAGELNIKSKLIREDIMYIFMNPDRMTQTQLADVYGISQPTVHYIQRRKFWSHITNELKN